MDFRTECVPVIKPSIVSVKRSSGGSFKKLASFFGFGNSNKTRNDVEDVSQLISGVKELSSIGFLTKKTAVAEQKGADALANWAHDGRNSSICDVMLNISRLMNLHAEARIQFSKDHKHFVKQLRKIAETEEQLKKPTKELKKLQAKQCVLENGILKLMRRGRGVGLLRQKLDKILSKRKVAEHNLENARAEAEVVKMFLFRDAMIGIADSYRRLSIKNQVIFNCQREITQFVPAVSTQDVTQMTYEASIYTRAHVDKIEHWLGSLVGTKTSSIELPVFTDTNVDWDGMSPPPPYLPSAAIVPDWPMTNPSGRTNNSPGAFGCNAHRGRRLERGLFDA